MKLRAGVDTSAGNVELCCRSRVLIQCAGGSTSVLTYTAYLDYSESVIVKHGSRQDVRLRAHVRGIWLSWQQVRARLSASKRRELVQAKLLHVTEGHQSQRRFSRMCLNPPV